MKIKTLFEKPKPTYAPRTMRLFVNYVFICC